MTWEEAGALASLVTTLIIAVTAVAALIQLRHMRTANQIIASTTLLAESETAEMRTALSFCEIDLEERMKDPAFREQLTSGRLDRNVHLELMVGNYWEKVGLLLRKRLLDRDVCLDWSSPSCARQWRRLEGVAQLLRASGSPIWRDFEYIANLSEVRAREMERNPLQLPPRS